MDISGQTGRYSNSTSTEAANDEVHLHYRSERVASSETSARTVESHLYFVSNATHRGYDYDDDEDDLNCNSYPAHDSWSIGRDRRGMYVPAYEDGPVLDDSTDELAPLSGESSDTRIFTDYSDLSGSGDTKRRSEKQSLRFEKVVSAPSFVSQQSMFQSERAGTEVISPPLPRQFVLKSRSKSFDQESPSPLTSPSSLVSPVTDRAESLVIESSKRPEITIKPKSFSTKPDSSHGSKYQNTSSVSSNDGDRAVSGKSQANRGRPSRRTRNAVAVVKAVVHDTREIIQAQVIEVDAKELDRHEEMLPNETEISQAAEKLRKLESILNKSVLHGQIISPEDEDSHREIQTAAVDRSDDEQLENEDEALPLSYENSSTESQTLSKPSLNVTEAEFQNIAESADNNDNRTADADNFEKVVAAKAMSVESDNESATCSEETVTSTLQRQGSIHPYNKKSKDGRRRAVSSRLPSKQIESNVTSQQLESDRLSRVKFTDASKTLNAKTSSQFTEAKSNVQIESKESVRAKTMGMDRLKKKTTRVGPPSGSAASGARSALPTAEQMDQKSPEVLQDFPSERFSVLLRKDENGYGMTIENSMPVIVLAVRPNGVAEKSGIMKGDQLVKINGTYVFDKVHEEVIKYIKSAGSFLDLTLQRPVRSKTGNNNVSTNNENQFSTLPSLSQSTKQRAKQTHSLKDNNQRITVDKDFPQKTKVQNQVSQSFSSIKRKATKDGESMRLPGEVPVAKKREATRVGSDVCVDIKALAERQISSGKDSASTQAVSSLKTKLSNVESIGISKSGGEGGGGGGGGGGVGGMPIIGMEDDDLYEEEAPPIDPIFNDLTILKQHVAHLAVFLKFLIVSSEPAPMLFSMITDYYHAAVREAMTAARWAFEIYTTFLVPTAPLKLSVDDGMVSSIENVLRNTKENELRTVFRPVENFVRETILVKELKDMCKKLSLGLGTMYGAQDLKPNMDRTSELRIVDSTLSGHFETWLMNEAVDSAQALAFCLATFFRQIGFVGGKNSALLESCPSFIFKDKKIMKYKLKKNHEAKGHVFNPHLCTSVTKCQNCERMIWGIGFQAYQCSNCEVIVHRRCADIVWQLCSSTLRRSKDPKRVVRAIGSSRKSPGREDGSNSIFHIPADEAVTVIGDKPSGDIKMTSGEKVSDISDVEQQSESDNELQHRPSSWPNVAVSDVVGSNVSKVAPSVTHSRLSDSDFDVEPELPPLSQVLSKEAIRKLKGKERKKQEYINELFYTERTHLRSLKVISRYFMRPMQEDGTLTREFIQRIFQNLNEVIELHKNLNKEFKKLRQKNEIVNDLGEVLVSRFSGEEFKEISSQFCQDQLYTLGILRTKQKENSRLSQILQDATLNGHCGRQELKDLLPREMQRLTKYPLLIENILHCTPVDNEEHERLTLALKLSKELLAHVNHAVRDCENFRRTQDMQSRLDRRPIENSTHPVLIEYRNLNLTQHKMLYDGVLTWRRPQRPVELHVALFEHFIVLLQKQDDRLVLRCQNTTIEDVTFQCSPVIKLEHLLTKDVAVDKRAFFLINKSSDAPQVHELVTKSKEEKNRWCVYIKEAVENYHKQYSNEMARQRIHPSRGKLNVVSSDTIDNSQRISQVDGDPNESVEEFQVVQGSEFVPELYETLGPDEKTDFFIDKAERTPILSELQEKNSVINGALGEKVNLLADNHHTSSHELRIDERNVDVQDLILRCLDEIKRLSRLGQGRRGVQTAEEVKDGDSDQVRALASTAENGGNDDDDDDDDGDDKVMISATEAVNTNKRLHQLLEILAVKVMDLDSLDVGVQDDKLSALLALTSDARNSSAHSEARYPVSRHTSHVPAPSGADVNADRTGRIRPQSPEERSSAYEVTSAVDNLLSSDDCHLTSPENSTTSDVKQTTLVVESFATDDVSYI